MSYFLTKRGKGKTLESIKISQRTGAPILTLNEVTKRYILDLSSSCRIQIPEPLTIRDINRVGRRTQDGIIIDDAKLIFENLLSTKIILMTDTPDNDLTVVV